ncbi:RPA family protein [Halocatena pleomorpha]|uniref:Uncharacterized protein n=1 Tax=Halocatena pleomorpha TaxID=1785090 RepID=A0A3P3R6I0_9EURY|nr:hypothetical protein [Halocatena pleomorpha]RRJ28173.1 hypothetical protein EIK79_16405 [Halocatena pleomorpha]
MSHSSSEERTVAPGGREVARRLFAAEYTDATYSYSESDEERAPNYVVTPTGARINRLFVAGVLTEVSPAGESMLRARVVDPTGAFVVYAGQYQPDAMAFLDDVTPPVFVAVTGKARTFSPDDTDVVYTSIRPEVITEIDSDTRDRWTVSTAERTLERIATVAGALRSNHASDSELTTALKDAGVDPSLAAGVPLALEQYGTTEAYLAELQRRSLDAVRLVAGEIDAVDELAHSPDQKAPDVSFTPVIDPALRPATTPDRESTPEPASIGRETREEPVSDDSMEPTPSLEDDAEESDAAFDMETDIDEEFDPEEFELDAEIRDAVESEYGTEFSTAAEVDASEESSIDEEGGDEQPDHSDEESEATAADAPAERDITSVLLKTMRDLDDGDGADRTRLIEQVSETTGASETAVSEAIQDALMSGQCYEPDDETLKPI